VYSVVWTVVWPVAAVSAAVPSAVSEMFVYCCSMPGGLTTWSLPPGSIVAVEPPRFVLTKARRSSSVLVAVMRSSR